MKFRGRMTDAQCMREFSNTVHTLSKLGKHVALCLDPSAVSFVVFDDGVPRRALAECKLARKNFFNEYDVFGVSEQFNRICLQFSPDLLAKATSALKSPQTSRTIKIKLTKKNLPCLTCEIEMPTQLRHSRVCTHDIPVEIIPRKNWPEFQLPVLPPFDISIQMPPLKRFKAVCEKMKFLNSQLTLEASRRGILALKTETDLVTVATYFRNLRIAKAPGEKDKETFEVKVDFKKIIGFLSIDHINPTNVICNIINKKLVRMDVIHDSVPLHYLIPGIFR